MQPRQQKTINSAERYALAAARNSAKRSRGVALITTLILLALLGALSVALSLLVSSDTMINGYYRNYRGAFYAADSGVNVVVESMKNAIANAANENAAYPNAPLPIDGVNVATLTNNAVNTMNASHTTAFPANFSTSYTPFENEYYTIGDTGSWHGQFEVVSITFKPPTFTATNYANDSASCWAPTQATCPPTNVANDQDLQWTFNYPYTIVVQGQSSGSEAEQVTESGTITWQSAPGGAANAGMLFSKWGAYITNFSACQGPLTPGNMTGPFFTDGQWNFGNFTSPGYTFNGTVGQVAANVSWWNNNNCTNSANAPTGFKQPNFVGGFAKSQNVVTPPADTFSQATAILDAKGIPACTSSPCPTDTAPTAAELNAELKTIGGTTYPATGTPPTGVYIPYYTSGSNKVFGCNAGSGSTISSCSGSAGGFYIQGNASITLSATTTGGNPTQTYSIVQGSTTTTIVVNNTAGTTTVTQNSGTPVVLQGVPSQLDPNTGAAVSNDDPSGSAVNPTLVYVNGNITGLTGPTSGGNALPAIQNNVGVTVTASGNINVTGDLEYESNSLPVNSSDVLQTSSNAGVLGIFTNGNINLNGDGGSGNNLTVDASLAALSGATDGTGTSGFCTSSSSSISACGVSNSDNIGTWTILGGRAEDQAHGVNISQGNTLYDQRFASGGFGPPWFPTSQPQPGATPTSAYSQVQVLRGSWAENRP
jgi:Tfp pilus assembly protein PilX